MKATTGFALKPHEGEYATWPQESELLFGGEGTGKRIPGYVLEAQYQCGDHHVFVTTWNCPYEESVEIILTNSSLKVLCHRSIGAMYDTVWLERHEVAGDGGLLLHCSNGPGIRVAVNRGVLSLERRRGDSLQEAGAHALGKSDSGESRPWWKFW